MRRFRIATLVCGLALLAWLVERAGPARLVGDLLRVGWWMAALLGIAAVRNAVRAEAVRLALGEDRPRFSFASMYAVLWVSEAVKFVAAAGVLFGETTKGWLLGRRVSGPRAVSAVIVDVLLYYLTAALFCLGGIGLFFAQYRPAGSLAGSARAAAVAGTAAIAVVLVAGFIAFRRGWVGTRRVLGPLASWGLIRRAETLERAGEIDAQLFGFHRRHPSAFRRIVLWDFASHFLSAFEVLVILRALGLFAGYSAAIVVEALTKLVGLGGLVVPGDVGLYQGGTGLIFRVMGYPVAAGVAVGIIRQIRSILWAGAGFSMLLIPGVEPKAGESDAGRLRSSRESQL